MSLETQELPTSAPTDTAVKPKRGLFEQAVLGLVIAFAVGLMLAWFAFLAWALYWLLSGLL